jgi:hypothetical protein
VRGWVVRALGMAAMHTAAQITVAAVGTRDVDSVWLARAAALAVVVGVAALWGALDGWRRLESSGWRWLAAGLVAGPVAGLFGAVGQGMLVDATGPEALLVALTGGAAFTALLVMIAAWLGIGVGRLLEPPRISPGSGIASAAGEFKRR